MVADHINERHQGCRGGVNPICQRRDIEIDAFAFIDVALAIDEVRRPNADGGRARGAEVVKRTGPPAASPIPARRDYYHPFEWALSVVEKHPRAIRVPARRPHHGQTITAFTNDRMLARLHT